MVLVEGGKVAGSMLYPIAVNPIADSLHIL